MHEQTPRAARTFLKRTQPLRALLQPGVVQRRRILHQQHRRFLPAAFHQRLAVRLQDVVAMHLLIVQETIRRLLLGAARKDRRQRRARMPLPGPAQPLQTRPQAPVGQVRTPELAPRPTRRVFRPERRIRPRRPNRRPPQRLRPTRFQTPQPHPLRRDRRRRPRRPTRRPAHALPTRRTVAGRRTRRLHARLHQHRPNPVPRRPVRRQTTHRTPQHVRRQVRYPNRRQQQKAVVGNNLPDVQPPRAVVPTQVRVARTQPQRRRHEAQNPQHARLRLQQIRQTAARRAFDRASGCGRLQKTTTQPVALLRCLAPAHLHCAHRRQAAAECRQQQPRRARRRNATTTQRTRLRLTAETTPTPLTDAAVPCDSDAAHNAPGTVRYLSRAGQLTPQRHPG